MWSISTYLKENGGTKSPTAWGNVVRSQEFGAGSCTVEILCVGRMFQLGRTG